MIAPVDTRAEQRLETVGKVGYAVSGLLHVLIGVIAVQVAFGSGASADQGGALGSIAAQPFGRAALWLAVVALAGLGLWQLWQAVEAAREGAHSPGSDPGQTGRDAGQAVKAAAKGVVYLAIAATAATYARGGSTSGNQQSADVTATLMQSALGTLVVGAIGLVILGVGGYHVYSGATERFLQNLRGLPPGRAGRGARLTGRVGYIAKGVALGVLGALFVLAAVQNDPSEAGGLDQALRTLGEQPFGQVLLVAVGVGFVAFGVFSFVRARYAKN